MYVSEKLIPGGRGHVCVSVLFCVTIAVSCRRPFFFPFHSSCMKSSIHLLNFISCSQKVCPNIAVELHECTVSLRHRGKALKNAFGKPFKIATGAGRRSEGAKSITVNTMRWHSCNSAKKCLRLPGMLKRNSNPACNKFAPYQKELFLNFPVLDFTTARTASPMQS